MKSMQKKWAALQAGLSEWTNDAIIKGKTELIKSREAGSLLAKAALAKKVSEVVFDRGGYIYTGSIKEIAEGAREAGLKF